MDKNTILVFSDNPSLSLELLGKANELAEPNSALVATLLGDEDDIKLMSEYGADVIYKFHGDKHNPEYMIAVLLKVIQEANPSMILIGATKLGMEVSPRISERLDYGYAPWVMDFGYDPATMQITANCMIFTGTGMETYLFKSGPVVLTAAPGIFSAQTTSHKTPNIVELSIEANNPNFNVMGYSQKPARSSHLENAKVVVDVGQGIRKREDLTMIQTLADLLDGQLGCSRPISSDRDWFPEWIGLSGAKIKPQLCLTVGISGAIQHVIGIRESNIIVSINNDENAPIFNYADYGIIYDLYEFIPILIEKIKERQLKPSWK